MEESTAPSSQGSRGQAIAFWACGGLKVIVLAWMGYNAFPLSSWDEAALNQPAYMHLFTGKYAVPTFAGRVPHTDVVDAWYNPLYVILKAGGFQLLGYSRWTSLSIDMGVHLLLSGLFAGIVWRTTRNGWLAGLFWLGSTASLGQVGRGEEFALLLGTLAVVAAGQTTLRWLLSVLLLGGTGAVSPLTAVLSTTFVVIRLWMEMGWGRPFVWRAVGTVCLAPSISLAIFGWHIHPYFDEARRQIPALLATSEARTLPELLADLNAFGVSSLVIFGLLAGGLTVRLLAERRKNLAPGPPWLNAIGCLLIVSGGGIALARLLGRPAYDYRWLAYLWSALAVVVINEMSRTIWATRTARTATAVGCLMLAFTLANRDTLRYCVAPLLWRADSVSYTKAVDEVNRIVPKNATVGGDSRLWMTITDGRPYLAVKWLGLDSWPEYLISTSLGDKDFAIFQKASWRQKIETEYQEIPLSWPSPPANHLSLGTITIPVFQGAADYRFRAWKRHSTSASGIPGAAADRHDQP